jgi:hypothetical protein
MGQKNCPANLFAGTGKSCGATLLDACASTLRVLHTPTYYGRSAVAHTPQMRFRLPSEVHSYRSRIPRSHRPRLSETRKISLLLLFIGLSELYHRFYFLSIYFVKFIEKTPFI